MSFFNKILFNKNILLKIIFFLFIYNNIFRLRAQNLKYIIFLQSGQEFFIFNHL